MTHTALPSRQGPAPRTTVQSRQQQLEQLPNADVHHATRALVAAWPNVLVRPSLRAPPGTVGLFLTEADAKGPQDAFLLGTEFAHHHPLPDGSLHLTLPRDTFENAVAAGWGIPHPMAGQPTVSPLTILIFAPRDADERTVVFQLVRAADGYARGA